MMGATGAPKFDPEALAVRQWQDFRRLEPGTYFGEARDPLTLEEAYAVQTEVARLRCMAGDAVAGYKVGCIGPAVVEQFGMSGPIHGRLFRSELIASGSTLKHTGYCNLAIEGEMAIRIGARGEMSAAFPVIELHQFVFRGTSRTLSELIANNGFNVGAVLSDSETWSSPDRWATARLLTVMVNGRMIDEGDPWAMPGGAVEAVDWLRKDLLRHGLTLQPGDLVLTGTPLGLYPAFPGDEVSVAVDGCELVNCRVV